MAVKSLSIRIQQELLDKLHVVADYEGRSANSQIIILIRDSVDKYEKEHGNIEMFVRKSKTKSKAKDISQSQAKDRTSASVQ